jgi:hypothetical protein
MVLSVILLPLQETLSCYQDILKSSRVHCRTNKITRCHIFCKRHASFIPPPPPPPGATQPIVGVYITALSRALASSRTRLLDHTQRRATVGRTPLNE